MCRLFFCPTLVIRLPPAGEGLYFPGNGDKVSSPDRPYFFQRQKVSKRAPYGGAMFSTVPIGIPGALLVPIRRPAYFDYRALSALCGGGGVFCYALPRCFCSLSLRAFGKKGQRKNFFHRRGKLYLTFRRVCDTLHKNKRGSDLP